MLLNVQIKENKQTNKKLDYEDFGAPDVNLCSGLINCHKDLDVRKCSLAVTCDWERVRQQLEGEATDQNIITTKKTRHISIVYGLTLVYRKLNMAGLQLSLKNVFEKDISGLFYYYFTHMAQI